MQATASQKFLHHFDTSSTELFDDFREKRTPFGRVINWLVGLSRVGLSHDAKYSVNRATPRMISSRAETEAGTMSVEESCDRDSSCQHADDMRYPTHM